MWFVGFRVDENEVLFVVDELCVVVFGVFVLVDVVVVFLDFKLFDEGCIFRYFVCCVVVG